MALAPWVPADLLDWFYLSANPAAIALIEAEIARGEPNRVNWVQLTQNRAAMYIIAQNIDRIPFSALCSVPEAIDIIARYPERIDWIALSYNRAAGALVEAEITRGANPKNDPPRVYWPAISLEFDEPFLRAHFDNIVWKYASKNPRAINLLRENPSKINYSQLNYNSAAIDLIVARGEPFDWDKIAHNSGAESLLRANKDFFSAFDILENKGCANLIKELYMDGALRRVEDLPPLPLFLDIFKSAPLECDWASLSSSSIIFEGPN